MMPWIAIAALVLAACLGLWLGFTRRWRGLIFGATLFGALFLLGYMMARWQVAYESFFFVMLSYLVSLPGLAGLLGGALLGWLGQRHRSPA